jgi:hypothetical protein
MKNRNRPARYDTGRLVQPSETGGYLILQWPVTRAPRARVVAAAARYAGLRAVAEGVAASIAAQVGQEYGPEDTETRMGWHRAHPPLGFEPPRWRVQWPLRRVRAGQQLLADGDYARQETALWAGVRAGLDAAEPPWSAEWQGWRDSLIEGTASVTSSGPDEVTLA